MCTDTENILDLASTKGFNVASEKESLVLKKNATILKFKERLHNGNGGGCLLAASLYTTPNDAGENGQVKEESGREKYRESGSEKKEYSHLNNQT